MDIDAEPAKRQTEGNDQTSTPFVAPAERGARSVKDKPAGRRYAPSLTDLARRALQKSGRDERIGSSGRTKRMRESEKRLDSARAHIIPITERAAPSAHFTRGFVPWRLSDDGPGASRTISMSRHPKPITKAVKFRLSKCFQVCVSKQTQGGKRPVAAAPLIAPDSPPRTGPPRRRLF